jgi:anaphase-promoting complex subunit 8
MALTSQQQAELHAQLQQAITACNERCLYFAAKWYSDHMMLYLQVSKE